MRYGTEAMKRIESMFGNRFFLNIEHPADERTRSRLAFYEHCGVEINSPVAYCDGESFLSLTRNGPMTESEILTFIKMNGVDEMFAPAER